MIRHRPLGSGHPYSPDTEQRWPVVPVVGEPLRLGVRTSGDVQVVTVELVVMSSNSPTVMGASAALGGAKTLDLTPVPRSSRGQTTDGGHLASAQARQARQAGGWQVDLPAAPAGDLRYRFTARLGDGTTETTRWYTVRGAAWRPAADTAVGVGTDIRRPVPGSVEVLDDGERIHRVRLALPLASGEHVTGFGERYDTVDQRGLTLDNQVFEQYKSQGAHRRTYLPMPFAHVVGGDGWGFHVPTTRRVWFDVGHTTADRLVIEAETDTLSDAEVQLSLAVYSGSPAEVLDQFLAEVGRPAELPAWVFRLWASGNEWNTQAEIGRQAALHTQYGIPVGNIVIEAWSDETTFTCFRDAQYDVHADGSPHRLGDFTFPPDGAWPDPKGMVDSLHDQDIRVHLWQIPLLKTRPHPTGQAKADVHAAIRDNVLVRETATDGTLRPYRNRGWWFPLGLMPDLTDRRAADWWTARRRYLVEEVGIDGFKTDGGEHAWGRDLVYLDGAHGDARNNAYPVAYAAAYGRLLESCGKAPVTFSRSGYAGSQAHGAFWAGDENSTWEAFRWSMIAGLGAASCGIVYWGWDIAGFSGPVPDAELYVRAMAASAFLPIMQYHSEYNHHRSPSRDRTPWNIAEQTGEASVIEEVRQIVAVRERLVGYLAEQARRTLATSRPLLRPLFFDHPDDPAIWEHPVQWTLGDHILVAPVLAPGQTAWPVYLPAGHWIDAWTGEPHEGRRVITAHVPRHHAPAYVDAGQWPTLQAVFRGE
ncbi:MAG: glycoside hydrolase family 31 [Propionibacteriaceae bacterium]|jgi:alpha-glucosidase (family GH31 glycosyl hydrolase)|nr:glycoside hydrolase family 31 [Propionibacteriaceae bacterium]